jgi:ATP-dependent DNA helicase RecG
MPEANTHMPEANTQQLLTSLPEPLRERLPAPGAKPRRAALRALIGDLCAWRPLSARELAEITGGRDPRHLVREVLSPMVDEGLLAHTIPAMERHPDQRYAAPIEPDGDDQNSESE